MGAMHLKFDANYLVPLGWLEEVWNKARRMMEDACAQLRTLGVSADLDAMMTRTGIEEIADYIRLRCREREFGDRQSLIAEYAKLWSLSRHMIAETPQAALDYIHKLRNDDSNAAHRLRNTLSFQTITFQLQAGHRHPKMERLGIVVEEELARRRKTLVLCLTHTGADELAQMLQVRVGQVYRLHGGLKERELKRQWGEFDSAHTGIAVATASLERKIGVKVKTLIHYNLISTDTRYLEKVVALPLYSQIIVAADHPLDLGRSFCHYLPSPRVRGTIRPSRKKEQGIPTPLLPFSDPSASN